MKMYMIYDRAVLLVKSQDQSTNVRHGLLVSDI